MRAFVTCPRGVAGELRRELAGLGLGGLEEGAGGVWCAADLGGLYRACLWSRLANRVLLEIARFPVDGERALYARVKGLDWSAHLGPAATLAVDFSGRLGDIVHTRFGAQRVKDAVVDHFRERTGTRPSVDLVDPDCRIAVRVHRGAARVSVDLSGGSLHRRGYRREAGPAPLKENLAAALLVRAGWPEIAAGGGALVDPMCGSGTLLIEGALMAAGIAPGLTRERFGFERWRGHDARRWRAIRGEAEARRREAWATWAARGPDVSGRDESPAAVRIALGSAARAGLEGRVRVAEGPLRCWVRPTQDPIRPGLVITNPPYGERIGELAALTRLYRQLGERLAAEFGGWRAAVFSADPELGRCIGLPVRAEHRLWNGPLECRLWVLDVPGNGRNGGNREMSNLAREIEHVSVSPSEAAMLRNRLLKNCRRLRGWLRGADVDCYRIYDADIPEYAFAVDVYRDWVHVAEYAAPPSVDPEAARRRLAEAMVAVPAALGADPEHVVLKRRERQRGSRQYARRAETGARIEVREGPARLLVNLHDYVDTGLFLDHRPLRRRIRELAAGKRFLNLFAYTAAATVHAGLGGARATVSVDRSARYLDWARENLERNRLPARDHRLVRADCLEWLEDAGERFDLIVLDPPTFSNAKGSPRTLDAQRDHAALIAAAARRLAPGGILFFSTNRRRFRLDPEVAERFAVEDWTRRSLDPDFARARPPPHRCWIIRGVEGSDPATS